MKVNISSIIMQFKYSKKEHGKNEYVFKRSIENASGLKRRGLGVYYIKYFRASFDYKKGLNNLLYCHISMGEEFKKLGGGGDGGIYTTRVLNLIKQN